MLGYIDNVKIISTFLHKSKPYGKIQNRAYHGFILRINGFAEYNFGDLRVRVNAGELLFLPKGASYEYVTSQEDDCLYTSVNFDADIENPEVTVYSLEDFKSANYMLQGFTEAWNFGTDADKYKCLSNFYELFSYISRIEHQKREEQGNYSIIAPAIEYMKSHIYDADFKIDKLHRTCGISDTYFRRIFASRFAMTPQEYVLKERITHAKQIIESGDYDSIKSVAATVGYSDPLYFSKAFRKYYGFPPSGIAER